jgi:DNA-binding HxlR family transcriptional regulator
VTVDKNLVIPVSKPCNVDACAVRDTLLIIGGKWKSIIMHTLHNQGTIRFNQLKKLLPDISQKMLTQQLRELERDGLIKRVEYDEMPPRVEYSLSDLGISVGSVYKTINSWQKEHLEIINNNRENYDKSP